MKPHSRANSTEISQGIHGSRAQRVHVSSDSVEPPPCWTARISTYRANRTKARIASPATVHHARQRARASRAANATTPGTRRKSVRLCSGLMASEDPLYPRPTSTGKAGRWSSPSRNPQCQPGFAFLDRPLPRSSFLSPPREPDGSEHQNDAPHDAYVPRVPAERRRSQRWKQGPRFDRRLDDHDLDAVRAELVGRDLDARRDEVAVRGIPGQGVVVGAGGRGVLLPPPPDAARPRDSLALGVRAVDLPRGGHAVPAAGRHVGLPGHAAGALGDGAQAELPASRLNLLALQRSLGGLEAAPRADQDAVEVVRPAAQRRHGARSFAFTSSRPGADGPLSHAPACRPAMKKSAILPRMARNFDSQPTSVRLRKVDPGADPAAVRANDGGCGRALAEAPPLQDHRVAGALLQLADSLAAELPRSEGEALLLLVAAEGAHHVAAHVQVPLDLAGEALLIRWHALPVIVQAVAVQAHLRLGHQGLTAGEDRVLVLLLALDPDRHHAELQLGQRHWFPPSTSRRAGRPARSPSSARGAAH